MYFKIMKTTSLIRYADVKCMPEESEQFWKCPPEEGRREKRNLWLSWNDGVAETIEDRSLQDEGWRSRIKMDGTSGGVVPVSYTHLESNL